MKRNDSAIFRRCGYKSWRTIPSRLNQWFLHQWLSSQMHRWHGKLHWTEHFYGNSLNSMLLATKCEVFQSQICRFVVCLEKLELLLIMLSLYMGSMRSSNDWVMAIKMRVLTKCCLKCSCGGTGESLKVDADPGIIQIHIFLSYHLWPWGEH